jgi:hypothetical protein
MVVPSEAIPYASSPVLLIVVCSRNRPSNSLVFSARNWTTSFVPSPSRSRRFGPSRSPGFQSRPMSAGISSSTRSSGFGATSSDRRSGEQDPRRLPAGAQADDRRERGEVLGLDEVGPGGQRGAQPLLHVGDRVVGVHRSSFPELVGVVAAVACMAFSSATSARLAVDFTVPWLIPSVTAISDSVRFDQ